MSTEKDDLVGREVDISHIKNPTLTTLTKIPIDIKTIVMNVNIIRYFIFSSFSFFKK
ncbi:hypothetical protein LCGC14_0990440 [marine sediment metagenome]|uniref:Uncharacterized protein n=1 Tax=marine sediment metagenome TaxID=412755 RepID=A0A0F9QPC7_9ZZZZ